MSKELFTIAFDLGGVIFATSNDTNIFSKNYLETELIPGIYDVILKLNKNEKNKLIIISKAYPNNAKKSREILKKIIYKKTMILLPGDEKLFKELTK